MKLVPLLEAGGNGREPCNVSLMPVRGSGVLYPGILQKFQCRDCRSPGIESLKKLDELIQGGCRIITLDSKLPVRGACNLRTDTGICQAMPDKCRKTGSESRWNWSPQRSIRIWNKTIFSEKKRFLLIYPLAIFHFLLIIYSNKY